MEATGEHKKHTGTASGYDIVTHLTSAKPLAGSLLPPDPIVTPIYHTANYRIQSCDTLEQQKSCGYVYTSLGNPNATELEDLLAKLEMGIKALVFPSGLAAISTTLLCFLNPGDHLVTQKIKYNGTSMVLHGFLSRWNIEVSEVSLPGDGDITPNLQAATRHNTRMYLIESPVNPTTCIVNLEKLGKLGKEKNILTVVDSTLASPMNHQPLTYGIDIVVHSCTKYFSGHNDLTAGCVIFNKQQHYMEMCQLRPMLTGPLDPANCVLLLRSLRTLHIRMKQHNENAQAVAEFLEGHPKVKRVLYTGLKSHPQHELAQMQMKGYGGVVSFILTSADSVEAFIEELRLFQLAASHGSVSCSVIHSGMMAHKHPNADTEVLNTEHLEIGLVRLSVGLEKLEDIIEDLNQALQKIQ